MKRSYLRDIFWLMHSNLSTFRVGHCHRNSQFLNIWKRYIDSVQHNKKSCDLLTLYGHIKTAQQRTIIQQYGDRYSGR